MYPSVCPKIHDWPQPPAQAHGGCVEESGSFLEFDPVTIRFPQSANGSPAVVPTHKATVLNQPGLLSAHPVRHRNQFKRHLQESMTEPVQREMSPAIPEAVAKTNETKKMRQVLLAPTGIGAFFSEWYLVPGAAFALVPLPLVIQYRPKARKLSICPSQGIYVQASRPSLNKIPFQLVQLFANHKANFHVDRTLNAKRKAN